MSTVTLLTFLMDFRDMRKELRDQVHKAAEELRVFEYGLLWWEMDMEKMQAVIEAERIVRQE